MACALCRRMTTTNRPSGALRMTKRFASGAARYAKLHGVRRLRESLPPTNSWLGWAGLACVGSVVRRQARWLPQEADHGCDAHRQAGLELRLGERHSRVGCQDSRAPGQVAQLPQPADLGHQDRLEPGGDELARVQRFVRPLGQRLALPRGRLCVASCATHRPTTTLEHVFYY